MAQRAFVIYGAPGTGKTATIQHIAENLAGQGYDPLGMQFISFTRTAARVLGMRVGADENASTLHSYVYHLLKLKPHQILSDQDYKRFYDQFGYEYKYAGITAVAEYLRILMLCYSTDTDLRSGFYEYSDSKFHSLNETEFLEFEKNYAHFKASEGKMGFEDILRDGFSISPVSPEVVFLDEAQDFTPIQWKLIARLFRDAERIYVAGDDDQAIFDWAGADAGAMSQFEQYMGAERLILSKSWRLPKPVFDVAQRQIERVVHRVPKRVLPSSHFGQVIRYTSPYAFDFSELNNLKDQKIMVLTRTNRQAAFLTELMNDHGLSYHSDNPDSEKDKLCKAFDLLTKKQEDFVDAERNFIIPMLKEQYRDYLLTHNALYGKPLELLEIPQLYRSFFAYYEPFTDKHIRVSTIHKVKGMEADTIVLYTDQPFSVDNDSEARVFYVGITRAKRNLILIEGKTNNYEIP